MIPEKELHEVIKKILIDTFNSFQMNLYLNISGSILKEQGRGSGKTYYIAVMSILHALDHPGKWLVLRDHYQVGLSGNYTLKNEIENLYKKWMYRWRYKLEIKRYGKSYKIRLFYDRAKSLVAEQ